MFRAWIALSPAPFSPTLSSFGVCIFEFFENLHLEFVILADVEKFGTCDGRFLSAELEFDKFENFLVLYDLQFELTLHSFSAEAELAVDSCLGLRVWSSRSSLSAGTFPRSEGSEARKTRSTSS